MRVRSRILLMAGLLCLSMAVTAGMAAAHGGGKHRGDKVKFGKFSKKGHADLRVEVRGAITGITPATATDPGSIMVSAGGSPAPAGFEWTCATPAGSDVSQFTVGDRVRIRCISSEGVLMAHKLRKKDKGDKVKIQARGTLTLLDTTTVGGMKVTVDPGSATDGLLPVTCDVTPKTRVFGSPVAGDAVKVECKSKKGKLVAKKISKRGAMKVGGLMKNQVQLKVKGPVTALVEATADADGSIAVASLTPACIIPKGTPATGVAVGDFVELKCAGEPLTFVRVEKED